MSAEQRLAELKELARRHHCELVTREHLEQVRRDMNRLGADLREAQRRNAALSRRRWRLW